MSEKPRHPDQLDEAERAGCVFEITKAVSKFSEVLDFAGSSRELALARTRLEEAQLWAFAALTGVLKP